jgi:hypothetical protein
MAFYPFVFAGSYLNLSVSASETLAPLNFHGRGNWKAVGIQSGCSKSAAAKTQFVEGLKSAGWKRAESMLGNLP